MLHTLLDIVLHLDIPAVKKQFHVVIIAIIVVSLIPAVIEAVRARSESRTAA